MNPNQPADGGKPAPVAAKSAAIDAAQAHPLTWKNVVKRALAVAVAGAALYLVLPKLIAVLGAWPRLARHRSQPADLPGAAGLCRRRNRGAVPGHPGRARHRGSQPERPAGPGRRPRQLRCPGRPGLPDRLLLAPPAGRVAGLPAVPPPLRAAGPPARRVTGRRPAAGTVADAPARPSDA